MIIILVLVKGHNFYIFHIKLNKSVYFKCVYLFFKTQLKKSILSEIYKAARFETKMYEADIGWS